MTKQTRLSPVFALSSLVFASLLGGCLEHPIKPVEFDAATEDETPVNLDVNKKVDVLLVIDNSGSMGEEQANLAANFGPFIETLELAGADYRIGIITTDLGGKDCSFSDDGRLQLSSCVDRPETFISGPNDQFAVACQANCQLGDADLAIRPTAIERDGEELARPWIQSFAGTSNLPDGVDPLTAFQCFAPQGISGCGFESPLEAMARALDNMRNPARAEFGFLRDDALLAVLVVTDEVDCSVTPGMESALFDSGQFFAEGVNYLTSAACWNAGVACSGDSPFDDCWDVNLDANGEETPADGEMVLRPVSRYVELLESIAASKTNGAGVLVSAIAGVPEGYSDGAAEIAYANEAETSFVEPQGFQTLFGIGAGCQNEVGGSVQSAVPPVRLKAVAEAFVGSGLGEGARNLYSVCAADYTPAIEDIVAGIEKELPPACFTGCALDIDTATEELDYSCTVLERIGEDEEYALPECALGQAGFELPAGADACWIAKTGADLADECVEQGTNLEFELIRRPGVPVASDSRVLAVCEKDALFSDC